MSGAAWFSADETTDHTGQPVPADSDFFRPPPCEIGAILSAESTLSRDCEPTAITARRIGVTAAACGITSIFWYLISLANWPPSQVSAVQAWGISVVSIITLITWLHQKPRYVCSYVGDRGVARFCCYGTRDRLTRTEIFLFSDAETLRANLRSIRYNWLYLHTEYDFIWRDSTDRRRYRLHGRHHSESGRELREEHYRYAQAVHRAWSDHLVPRAVEEIETRGFVRFAVTRGRSIEIGPKHIALNGKALPVHRTRIKLDRGFLSFRVDLGKLGPFRRCKTHTIRCNQIANLYLLLMLLTDLFGSSFREIGITATVSYHALHPAG